MGLTLAVYASICRELEAPFVFPGSLTQWNGLMDMTDATVHTDADLGRQIEVVTDISKSRLAGFGVHHRTVDSFTALFDRYRADRLIPGA